MLKSGLSSINLASSILFIVNASIAAFWYTVWFCLFQIWVQISKYTDSHHKTAYKYTGFIQVWAHQSMPRTCFNTFLEVKYAENLSLTLFTRRSGEGKRRWWWAEEGEGESGTAFKVASIPASTLQDSLSTGWLRQENKNLSRTLFHRTQGI